MTNAKFAIIYDFDGTLSPKNMQEYNFIPELKITPEQFWDESNQLAEHHHADKILTYMYLMLKKAKENSIKITKDNFYALGKKIEYFEGVEKWFELINAYGKKQKITVQHFIISSGLREMLDGTSIVKHFEKIYASGFMYDQNRVAEWPALAINFTTKTQFIFRINKGCLDEHDDDKINKFTTDDQRPIPFSNMLFIGDGSTDIPCMRLVKDKGGHSIAVYPEHTKGAKNKAIQLEKDGRVNLVTHANYTDDSVIYKAVTAIIDKLAANQKIKYYSTKPAKSQRPNQES